MINCARLLHWTPVKQPHKMGLIWDFLFLIDLKYLISVICCHLDGADGLRTRDEWRNSLQRHRGSAATLKVLASMPSQTSGERKKQQHAFQFLVNCFTKADLWNVEPFVHKGPNRDAAFTQHAKQSQRRKPQDSSHQSRFMQDYYVYADMEDNGPKGRSKMLTLPKLVKRCCSQLADQFWGLKPFRMQETRNTCCPDFEASQQVRNWANCGPCHSAWRIRWRSGR